MMKVLLHLIFFLWITQTLSKPEGYFKQQYQYKKSSATYKNNELQLKDDDQGYYKKQGDLEGYNVPQVEQHNEHSTYMNPGHAYTAFDDRDLTGEAENAFARHGIGLNAGANSGYSAQSSYSQSSSSSSNLRPTYISGSPSSASLSQLTRNLESELSRQIQTAIRESTYSSSTNQDLYWLEQDLKANLTRQLQQALDRQFGVQPQRGTQTTSNYNAYDSQELNDLKRQMEDNLLRELREGYRTQSKYSESHMTSQQTSTNLGRNKYQRPLYSGGRDSAEIEDLNRHGIQHYLHQQQEDVPERITFRYPDYKPSNAFESSQSRSYTSANRGSNYFRENTPTYTSQITINPTVRLTDVAQNVQNIVSTQLNEALSQHEQKYSGNSYLLTDSRQSFEGVVEDFKNMLKNNLTRTLQEELDKTYGVQHYRAGYAFSSGSTSVANYRLEDLDSLKDQVRNNLFKHLEKTLKSQEDRYIQQKQEQLYLRRDHTLEGPSQTRYLTDYNNGHSPVATSSHSSWSSSSSWSTSGSALPQELETVGNEVQTDISRQIANAVRKQQSGATIYSSQSNEQLLQGMMEELKQNLTRKLQESLKDHYGNQVVRSGSSYSLTSSGSYNPRANYEQQQLSDLSTKLQEDLTRQLNEQFGAAKKSSSSSAFSQYSSSSSSSSASNYRPSRYTPDIPYRGPVSSGFKNYDTFNAGYLKTAGRGQGLSMTEDCDETVHYRKKRSYGSYYNNGFKGNYGHPLHHSQQVYPDQTHVNHMRLPYQQISNYRNYPAYKQYPQIYNINNNKQPYEIYGYNQKAPVYQDIVIDGPIDNHDDDIMKQIEDFDFLTSLMGPGDAIIIEEYRPQKGSEHSGAHDIVIDRLPETPAENTHLGQQNVDYDYFDVGPQNAIKNPQPAEEMQTNNAQKGGKSEDQELVIEQFEDSSEKLMNTETVDYTTENNILKDVSKSDEKELELNKPIENLDDVTHPNESKSSTDSEVDDQFDSDAIIMDVSSINEIINNKISKGTHLKSREPHDQILLEQNSLDLGNKSHDAQPTDYEEDRVYIKQDSSRGKSTDSKLSKSPNDEGMFQQDIEDLYNILMDDAQIWMNDYQNLIDQDLNSQINTLETKQIDKNTKDDVYFDRNIKNPTQKPLDSDMILDTPKIMKPTLQNQFKTSDQVLQEILKFKQPVQPQKKLERIDMMKKSSVKKYQAKQTSREKSEEEIPSISNGDLEHSTNNWNQHETNIEFVNDLMYPGQHNINEDYDHIVFNKK